MSAKQPIRLFVFYHDDVDADTQRIVPRNYLKDCIVEIKKITGRECIIEYKRSIEGVTDFNYKGHERTVLEDWIRRVGGYVVQNNLSWKKTYRYLLVTSDKLNDTILGVTYEGHNCLISSLVAYQNIGHELGHSFGATHEDAELQYNSFGLLSETFVYPHRDRKRGNAYRYSLKNRENIANFLRSDD
ncbi:hypothetical protein QN386_21660 [Pseudomonas sp. CCI3.2]|uniref:hypothetical protein n=1 Tax=unclassified Pseudomonas TaxID=196821 RepID=UPI002AC9A028|nr:MULTISPECIES: hypothetical protein [unclassified Pseudomonas]MEB0079718.1 hypothetical protein [Pseudomonas sp. MH10out]MEB0092681.1 hypothetical protein [Pseudomonas sp. CCI4.2]MEB0103914.1 hypothetical protein [Pseudomonas sp. CCI3.2]MEB0122478.1 hypothetical protein [Pseudomonas sp. CCI1.2]MEB0132175.1 hypothetical protein [Pseudomonas sp. CCI2.4]